MFSTRRRCTASSSAIKMLAAMAFLGRYNYLSRIGALSPMPINALLNVVGASPSIDRFTLKCNTGSTPDDLALRIRPPQAAGKKSASQEPAKNPPPKPRPAKLPEWNLADLYSGIDAPEITRDLEKMDAECVAFETDYKGKLAEQTAGGRRRKVARRGGQALRGDRRSRRAGWAPMRAWFMPATASIPRSPNSMATFPSG